MKTLIAVAFTALTACESTATTTNPPPVTTTSAKMQQRTEARRREVVPPSPPPVMGQMPNSDQPLPQLPDNSATIVDNPPPGTSVTETLMPTMNKRDERIEKTLRAAIAADNTLSPEAKQVEVIVKDRKIILKGQAHSERERMDIDTKARATDDVIDVDDQIQLVP